MCGILVVYQQETQSGILCTDSHILPLWGDTFKHHCCIIVVMRYTRYTVTTTGIRNVNCHQLINMFQIKTMHNHAFWHYLVWHLKLNRNFQKHYNYSRTLFYYNFQLIYRWCHSHAVRYSGQNEAIFFLDAKLTCLSGLHNVHELATW